MPAPLHLVFSLIVVVSSLTPVLSLVSMVPLMVFMVAVVSPKIALVYPLMVPTGHVKVSNFGHLIPLPLVLAKYIPLSQQHGWQQTTTYYYLRTCW